MKLLFSDVIIFRHRDNSYTHKFILLVMLTVVIAWEDSYLSLDGKEIPISKLTIWNSRAFLCLPRISKQQLVTLLEVPWPEGSFQTLYNTKPFPDQYRQNLEDCNSLQSAVSADIDYKGRIYVLDKGYGSCGPKVVIYDMRTSRKLLQIDLNGVPSDNLDTLVIDDESHVTLDIRVYIGGTTNSSIIILNPKEQVWWKMILLSADPNEVIAENMMRNTYVTASQLTLSKRDHALYIASKSSPSLFKLDFNSLKKMEEPLKVYCNRFEYNGQKIIVDYQGDMFGNTTGLFVDPKGGINYVYVRDFVALRSENVYDEPLLAAENTQVVMQNASLLKYPVQIFSDSYYQLWVLNGKLNDYQMHTVKIKNLRIDEIIEI